VVGLTVIIPTVGRDSLAATLGSLTPQLSDEDDIMVVEDGETQLGAYGHGARNWMLDRFDLDWGGTHFWSIDDDDIAASDALNIIRTAIESFPGAWFIFQRIGGANSHYHGLKVPHTKHKVLPGNVGTPCIVWPASAEARWGTGAFAIDGLPTHNPGYFGDYEMAVALQKELGDPVWVDEVIAIIRP
jgi:hypothetical protein